MKKIWALVVLQWAPYIFNQIIILIKVKLTIYSKTSAAFQRKEDVFLAWERAFSREKAIFESWERWMAEIAAL